MAKKRLFKKYDSEKIWWLRFVKDLLAFAVILVLVFTLVLGVSRVNGSSMSPTLKNGQAVLYYRLDKNYNRGDIISLWLPNGDYYVKRVIAVEGDTVDIRDGVVYINGSAETGTYINGKTEPAASGISYPLTVKAGKVFVLGDNRENSVDSRNYGEFALSQTRGKIIFY